MLDPVTVEALLPGQAHKYRVRAGKRRLTACRDLGLESVPAVILPAEMDEIAAALVPLAENILRRENPLHEAREIERFFVSCRDSGMPEADIKPYLTGLGFPAALIDQRLRLLGLPPEIQQAVGEGSVKPTVGGKIANRNKEEQREIIELLGVKGKLTTRDVSDVRRVQVEGTLAALPDTPFDLPPGNLKVRVA